MKIGLALGGGGVVGVAWEIGVLRALNDAGFQPTRSKVVVGTSAGALIGSRLLHGHSLADMESEQAEADVIVGDAPPADLAALAEVFQMWVSQPEMTPDLAKKVAEKALQAPTMPEQDWVGAFAKVLGTDGWPPGDLRIITVAASSGERVVWTAADGIALGSAVASSCAVPGIFPPVTLGPDRYIDGGVWSGSNVDILSDSDIEAVVFIGPMGEAPNLLGRISASALDREAAALEARGIPLHTITPGPRFGEIAVNLMDPTQRQPALRLGLADGAAGAQRLAHVLDI